MRLIYLFLILFLVPLISAQEWISLDSGTDQKLHSVYFVNQRVGWAVGGEGIGIPGAHPVILKTTNGGDDWTEQAVSSSVNDNTVLTDVCFASSLNGWAVGSNGVILKTEDGGEIWTADVSPTGANLYGVSCLDEETAVIGGNAGFRLSTGFYGNILRATDGETWTDVHGDEEGALVISGIYFEDSNVGWATGSDGTGGVVLKTTNGGESWPTKETLSPTSLSDISCFEGVCWAVGGASNIYRNAEGDWVSFSENEPGLLTGIAFLDSMTGFATGESRLIQTLDGGVSWDFASTDISTGTGLLPVAWMREVMCKSDVCWAVGNDGTILRTGEIELAGTVIFPDEGEETIEIPDEEEPEEDFEQPANCPAFMDDCEAGYNPLPEYGANGCIVDYTCMRGRISLEDIQTFIGRVPGLGDNERINIYINYEDSGQQIWSAIIENGELMEVNPSEVDNPTLRVETTGEVIERILASDEPSRTAILAIKNKEILIRANTFGGKIKLAIARIFIFFKK